MCLLVQTSPALTGDTCIHPHRCCCCSSQEIGISPRPHSGSCQGHCKLLNSQHQPYDCLWQAAAGPIPAHAQTPAETHTPATTTRIHTQTHLDAVLLVLLPKEPCMLPQPAVNKYSKHPG